MHANRATGTCAAAPAGLFGVGETLQAERLLALEQESVTALEKPFKGESC